MNRSRQIQAWLLLLPALVLLVAFTHWPTVATFIDSLQSTPRGSRPAAFVGLEARPQRCTVLPVDAARVRAYIEEHAAAA